MATITVEGLGQVEIDGTTPTAQEIEAIKQALESNTNSETVSTSDQNILTIEQYKKENPESANIPDRKLAEDLYEKNFKGKMDETTFYKTVFPQIAEKRSDDVYNDFVFPDDDFGSGFDSTSVFRPTTSELAEKSEVSLNNPASSNARFAASLGYNEEQKILAIKQTLSESFKEDIDVRVGPSTGELEYYNPKIGKYALVDKPGMDMGDFADLGGDAMVIIPDVAATIGVGYLTGGAGGITAGAAAAMAGEYARLKLGQKLYGINKDMTDEQLWGSIKLTGAISFGGGVLGLGVIKSIKSINNLIKGRVIPDDVIGTLDDNMIKESDAVSKTINDALDTANIDSKLKYTLGQAIDDPDLLATQQAFENVKRLGYVNEFRTFGREQAEALNNYFGLLKSGFGTMKNVTPKSNVPNLTFDFYKKQLALDIEIKKAKEAVANLKKNLEGKGQNDQGTSLLGDLTKEYRKLVAQKEALETAPVTTYDAGVLIQDVIKKSQAPAIKNIIKKQQQSEELLTKSVFNLPDGSAKITGQETQSIIKKLGEAYKSSVKEAGENLDKASGFKIIDTDIISKTVRELSEKEQLSLVEVAKAEGIFKKEVFDNIIDANGTISLASARETLKSLNQLIKDKGITGNVTGESISLGKILKLKSAFIKQIKKNAGKNYVDELENFNDLVIRNKQLLDNKTISELSSVENGIFKVAEEDVFLTTFKKGLGSGKAAKEVYDVIKNSPDALTAYKNSIFEFYKTKVLTDGIPNLTKHKAFIENYKAPLKQFFNEAEFTKISRIGGLQKAIEDNLKLTKKTTDTLFKSFAGRLENASPQEIFKKIYAPNNIGEIRELKNILKNNPKIYEAFQRNVLADINEKVMVSSPRLGVKVISPKAFNNYLNGAGGEAGHKIALEQIFGKEYVANLDILNRALQISGRKAPARAAEGVVGNFFTDIIRARLGQFTKAGRIFTALRRVFSSASNRVIKNALLNPQSLRELIELKNLKPGSKRAAIILNKLGGHTFIPDEGGVLVPQEDKKNVSETPYNPKNQSSNTSNIEEIIETTDNVMTASLPNTIETEDLTTFPEIPTLPLDTTDVNPASFNNKIMAQDANGLTQSEQAFLDDEEKAMRLRSRGITA